MSTELKWYDGDFHSVSFLGKEHDIVCEQLEEGLYQVYFIDDQNRKLHIGYRDTLEAAKLHAQYAIDVLNLLPETTNGF